MTDAINMHISAASTHAHEASQPYAANPAILSAVSQAHALTALALIFERILAVVEEDSEEIAQEQTQPLVYAVARVIGGEIMH